MGLLDSPTFLFIQKLQRPLLKSKIFERGTYYKYRPSAWSRQQMLSRNCKGTQAAASATALVHNRDSFEPAPTEMVSEGHLVCLTSDGFVPKEGERQSIFFHCALKRPRSCGLAWSFSPQSPHWQGTDGNRKGSCRVLS